MTTTRRYANHASVTPIRTHIRHLLNTGMRLADIAADAGMATTGHLSRIMYGPDKTTCRTEVAARILAVTPRPVDAGFVDGIGVRRRTRALVRAGWEMRTVAIRTGYHPSVVSGWANARLVHRATHDKVRAVYDQLSALDGGSWRARNWATRRGWDPVEAWSDHTIDDPAAEPYDWCRDDVDEVLVRRAVDGGVAWGVLNRAERVAVAHRLAADGYTKNRLNVLMGVSGAQFRRWCDQVGFTWPDRITAAA